MDRPANKEAVMSEENKRISRRIPEEVFGKGNLDVIDELVADDFVNHDPSVPPEVPGGSEGLKTFVQVYRTAFPDLKIKVEDQVAEGDQVVTRWSASGTQKGELMGIPATGKQGAVTGITIDRIKNGRIVESWNNWDTLGLLQQLGVVPEVGAPTR
jgi:steroid delta-isomerase-like uncharacterized protein